MVPSCRTFFALVCVCFCTLSASGLDALISRVSHTVDDRSRGVCCVSRMARLLDLAVCFGLDHHCRRAADSSVLRGSAGGLSEPSVSQRSARQPARIARCRPLQEIETVCSG